MQLFAELLDQPSLCGYKSAHRLMKLVTSDQYMYLVVLSSSHTHTHCAASRTLTHSTVFFQLTWPPASPLRPRNTPLTGTAGYLAACSIILTYASDDMNTVLTAGPSAMVALPHKQTHTHTHSNLCESRTEQNRTTEVQNNAVFPRSVTLSQSQSHTLSTSCRVVVRVLRPAPVESGLHS